MPATRTIATLATAAALLLAACGGDGAATGATSTTATTAGPARTAGPSTTAPATCRNDLRIVNGEASEPVVPNGDFAPTTMWADKGPHPANTVTYDNSLELAFSTYERGPDPQFGYSIPADPDTPAGEHHVYLSLVDIADGLVEAGELFVGQLDAPDRPDADGEINFAFWEFGDDQGSCNANDRQCDRGGYDNYTVEVVDRMGHDSYTPDHGVLIAKNKTGVDLAPFMWAIDAHPEDINTVTGVGEHEGREVYDFVRPDGTRAAISLGDARQLADALFHAGTGEGVVNTWTDEANGLQFYVLTTEHDAEDPLSIGSYRVAVRSLDGHGPIDPATTVAGSTDTTVPLGEVATIEFDLANIGITDISRLSVDTALEHRLPYEYVEVAALGGTTVQVHVGLAEGSTGAHGVTLTATSELTGEAVSATATVVVTDAGATGQALPGLALVLPVLPAGWLAVRRRP